MTTIETLAGTPVSALDLTRYVEVPPDTAVSDTVAAMNDADLSCACVVDGGGILGIYTQRDVLNRAIGRPTSWRNPISEDMSRPVETMQDDETVADGLATMVEWWVRSVPVLSSDKRLVGNLSFYAVMSLMADSLAQRIESRSSETSIGDELGFVDFTGLNMAPPVVMGLDDPVSHAIHHMRARGIGSVLVADGRGRLAGLVTEFDLQTKVGCDHADVSSLRVADVMSEAIALSPRSSIADAIREIADHGHSNVPLVAETGRPAGVASFRDVAAYIEVALEASP